MFTSDLDCKVSAYLGIHMGFGTYTLVIMYRDVALRVVTKPLGCRDEYCLDSGFLREQGK